jgi:hypothetical protein
VNINILLVMRLAKRREQLAQLEREIAKLELLQEAHWRLGQARLRRRQ